MPGNVPRAQILRTGQADGRTHLMPTFAGWMDVGRWGGGVSQRPYYKCDWRASGRAPRGSDEAGMQELSTWRQIARENGCSVPGVAWKSSFGRRGKLTLLYTEKVRVKVAHTWLPSLGFRSWSRFLAVSLQVTWVINPAVGCHHFPPGYRLLYTACVKI